MLISMKKCKALARKGSSLIPVLGCMVPDLVLYMVPGLVPEDLVLDLVLDLVPDLVLDLVMRLVPVGDI
jgi:hypothetical protein